MTIQRNSWSANPVFAWLQGLGQIEQQEMFNVFNMGLGFILVVAPEAADQVREHLTKEGLETWQIGAVTEGERAVQIV